MNPPFPVRIAESMSYIGPQMKLKSLTSIDNFNSAVEVADPSTHAGPQESLRQAKLLRRNAVPGPISKPWTGISRSSMSNRFTWDTLKETKPRASALHTDPSTFPSVNRNFVLRQARLLFSSFPVSGAPFSKERIRQWI